jgi:hypothetical protein
LERKRQKKDLKYVGNNYTKDRISGSSPNRVGRLPYGG